MGQALSIEAEGVSSTPRIGTPLAELIGMLTEAECVNVVFAKVGKRLLKNPKE